MADLAARLGTTVPSDSTLERNDERGAAKAATVERALAAITQRALAAITQRAQEVIDGVAWAKAMEAQTLTEEAKAAMVRRLIAGAVAAR